MYLCDLKLKPGQSPRKAKGKGKGKSDEGKNTGTKRKRGNNDQGSGKKQKKAKKRRMPRDAFQLFCAGRRASLRKARPEIAGDAIKLRSALDVEWANLAKEKRKAFEDRAAKNLKEFEVS